MRKVLQGIYYFLPVQLFLLHFRKYQLLLLFWLIITLTITGNFASHFGASSLFLAPEYLGDISFGSMALLGGATAVFTMGWHITTFIIHSSRIRFMGATRHAFLMYCMNNSIIPLLYLVFYSVISVHFQWKDEHLHLDDIIYQQFGFFLGFIVVILVSFAYFFRVSRDLLKSVLAKITNPANVIRELIPYDTLDDEMDILRTKTYLSSGFKVKRCDELENYHPRLLSTVLRRHHRNAIFATIVAYVLLLLLGIFMEEPFLRIPAGASFLLFFSIIMGVVGAVKYFLRSWETLGWVMITLFFGWLVKHKILDLRSIAYGMNYEAPNRKLPEYNYDHLLSLFNNQRYNTDKKTEEGRLEKWKSRMSDTGRKHPLVVISISGGGSRASFWTFRTLQYIDSASGGQLFNSTVLMTGASGGMLGGAYWRAIHDAYSRGTLHGNSYRHSYQVNIGKDLLNSIIFSMASVDLISPFNKISLGKYSYTKDRGYAMEQELIRNTNGLLDKNLAYYKDREAQGIIPEMIVNGTIINDGRRLMMGGQPLGFLTRPEYALGDTVHPTIDAVDYAAFFAGEDPYNLRITSALRMNATFPVVLPVVKLPSNPRMNVMDAGLRDNFGTEVASRYVFAMREWLQKNTSEVIFLEIRDTKEYEIKPSSEQTSLANMLAEPLFVIQDKWETFQSYEHNYLKDYAPYFMGGKMRYITLQYVPKEEQKVASLNFHLTRIEKEDIFQSIDYPENRASIDTLLKMLR